MSDQGPKTILLVEDEALIALAEKRQLEREGYRVLWAASGRAAIELIRDAGRGADLILMDIDLGSGMDGTLAAEEILKDHEIPVIFISSHIEKDIVERTEKITSYGYVVKNSSPTVLSTSIKMAFRLFGARREAKSRTQDLAQVLGGISDAFFTMDEDLVVTYFNPAAERMLQRPAGEVVGKYLFDTFPEARGTVSDEKYHEAVRERQFLAFETWFEPYRNWYDVRVYPMPGGIAVYFQITTERKLLEKRLAESELRFRELFDKIDTGVAIYRAVDAGADFEFVDFNKSAEGQDGQSRQELLGRRLLEARPGVMEFGLFEVMQRVWKTGLPERLPIRHYQDERLAGYYDNYVYKLSSGEIVTVFDNVTAQKLGEAAIKAGEEQLRLIADSIPAFVSMFDAETLRYKFVNRQFELSFAKPREAMIGRHISETLGEENFRFALGFIEEARTGHETGYENSFELADGTHWLQVRYVPQFNAQGRVSDLIVLAFDVTQTRREREKSESLIRDKELILKEGHHRSKNYMNTISSLLRLQAGLHSSPEIAGILDDVAGRIAAMEILYDKLYSSDQGGKIPLRDYLSSLLDEIAGVFPRTRPVRLDVEIDDLVLDSKPLSTLGIIVNELMTNSMKHAFKGREDGWIGIKVSQRDAMLRLSYEDDGPGLPEAVSLERSTGFGLELVGMLAGKLGGSLVLERGRGARFVLEFEAFPDQR